MLCEKCGKNHATTHIKSVVNGVVREINLCGICAAEQGLGGFAQTGLAGMLASMLGDVAATGLSDGKRRCTVCGSAFSDIATTGKVGCAECYNTFKSELLPYLKRVHGATTHSGKIPNRAPLAVIPEEDSIDNLKLELNRLVSEEKYEQAAVIRDKIRKLEGEKNEQ
ncbi:MAG: UvrB/UvrC motif-containing protein [Clostridia bacterium]|nr:UvrB/UvrC motif-containing protein [Clostridia bacterium]